MARFEKLLVKFVVVAGGYGDTPQRDWLGMFNTEAEARASANATEANGIACYVEKWTYPLRDDGTAGKPLKCFA